MSQYIDIAFINQNPNVLQQLVEFEKHEEMLRNLCTLLQSATQHQPGDPDYDEYRPDFNFDLQFNFAPHERIQVHGMDFDDPEEYFDAEEILTEEDRTVPQNVEEPIHWRDLLDLEEYEDAPDNIQEMLEIALGDQRRIPEML